MGNLEKHAKFELERAGLFDKDSDYNGMLGEATMRLIKVFASEGHSGFSASLAVQLFQTLAQYKTLTPITDDPEEWMNVNEHLEGTWQNKRDPSLFSEDGGKTYYSVEDKNDKDRVYMTSRFHTKEDSDRV